MGRIVMTESPGGRTLEAGASDSEVLRIVLADDHAVVRVAGTLVEGFLDAEQGAAHTPHETLSDREREVVVRIAQGYSNKEIVAELELSVKTVETLCATPRGRDGWETPRRTRAGRRARFGSEVCVPTRRVRAYPDGALPILPLDRAAASAAVPEAMAQAERRMFAATVRARAERVRAEAMGPGQVSAATRARRRWRRPRAMPSALRRTL